MLPSAKRPLPRWNSIWSTTIVIAVLSLVASESVWRLLGYRPSVSDSPALWQFWYENAMNGGPRTIAIIGSSRIQAGLSRTQMSHRLPGYRVVQLGQYAGGSPIGVLRAIALDRRFNGIVICDTLAPFLVRTEWESQRREYEYTAGTRSRIEAALFARFQEVLAVSSTSTGTKSVARELFKLGSIPTPGHVIMRADRSLELEFSKDARLDELRGQRLAAYRLRYQMAQHPAPNELDDEFAEINGFVRRIQLRGGQVVFVQMPSSGGRLALEEEYHPKDKYWDRFAAGSNGICIHSAELASSRGIKCPDDSHLDCNGAIRFTNAILDELVRQKVCTAAQ